MARFDRNHWHGHSEIATGYAGIGMGIDAFPEKVKNSHILTGNNLGLLGLVKTLPSDEEVAAFSNTDEMCQLLAADLDSHSRTTILQTKAKELLDNGRVIDAWKVLLM